MKWIENIKNNHALMIIICCILPLITLFVAVRYLGVSNSYLYWGVLALCLLSHFFMMKHMHKGGKEENSESHKGGGCH